MTHDNDKCDKIRKKETNKIEKVKRQDKTKKEMQTKEIKR